MATSDKYQWQQQMIAKIDGCNWWQHIYDDGDGQPDHQNPKDRAEAAEDLAEAGDRTDVSVSYMEHDKVKNVLQIECVAVRLMSALYTVTSRLQHDAKYFDELQI